jgi:hypothetical protein
MDTANIPYNPFNYYRTNQSSLMLTKEQVISKLLENKPISIIRGGDGEGIVLNALTNINTLELASTAVIKRQLGFDPSLQQVKEIRQNLIDAYTHADIIGIPAHKQQTSGHWTKVLDILNENVPGHTTTYCDIDLAYQMLSDNSYDQLLQNRHVLNYISCRDLDEGFKRKWNIKTVNKYTIAPEKKFVSGYEGDEHFPTQFNRIPRWMDVQAENFPGSLLFVGAGVVGKIYCNWWRDRGGVAFDFGGVADIFFGKVTRGPDRGLDKDDPNPIHKL